MSPEFSIVIPVYGGEDYLAETLESILGQTYGDLEVICVDDCGPDGSAAIVQSFAARDERVRLVRQPENRGSARARRRGVLESRGHYVLFSDQDDGIAPDTCRILHDELEKDPVDILQYDSQLFNDGGETDEEIKNMTGWLRPFDGRLEGRLVVEGCFEKKLFGYSIWNKAYEGEFCRKAFAATEDVPIPLGEDNYASFVLFYFARSYRGIPDRKLYLYHYGRGYTGHGAHSVESFKRTVGLAVATELIRRFLVSQGTFEEYRETFAAAKYQMLYYIFDRWEREIADEDKAQALGLVLDQWSFVSVADVVRRSCPRYLGMLMRVGIAHRSKGPQRA